MCKGALQDPDYIAVAGIAVQAITGVRATVCYSKTHIAPWGLKENKPIAVKARVTGMQAYRFLSSVIDVVMPRIKDYRGVPGTSGDGSGNLTFGFSATELALFPEIEGKNKCLFDFVFFTSPPLHSILVSLILICSLLFFFNSRPPRTWLRYTGANLFV